MYKKHASCLALIAFASSLATAGTPVAADAQALAALFAEPTAQCGGQLEAGELATPGLLQTFYAERGHAPAWSVPARRAQLATALQALADDGLEPAHYSLPDPAADALCQELQYSRAYLRALQHLSRGKVSQEQVEPFWRAPDSLNPDPRPSVLSLAWQGLDDLPGAFAAARPSLPQYQRLRQALVELRQQPPAQWPEVPGGRLLKPGMHDPRVPLLAARLSAEGYYPEQALRSPPEHYDEALADAVRAFQSAHELQDDALVGNDTLAALNTPASARLDQLRVNLERWRWLAGDIEQETLLVDIAGGLLFYFKDGVPLWQGRAQVGRPTRQTPRLKSLVSRLTLNPTWTVPPTILRQDKLPEIRRDPGYLARNDLRVLDAQGRPLDPASIDWERPGQIVLRQDAGPRNPLGKLAIRFHNPFSVYLHDTPSQQLFDKSPRTFSSGCVRIEGILGLLDVLLPQEQCTDVAGRIASGRTQEVRIERRLPIVLAYWTANVDDQGRLSLRNAPYNLDPALLAALRQPPH